MSPLSIVSPAGRLSGILDHSTEATGWSIRSGPACRTVTCTKRTTTTTTTTTRTRTTRATRRERREEIKGGDPRDRLGSGCVSKRGMQEVEEPSGRTTGAQPRPLPAQSLYPFDSPRAADPVQTSCVLPPLSLSLSIFLCAHVSSAPFSPGPLYARMPKVKHRTGPECQSAAPRHPVPAPEISTSAVSLARSST